ncbi:hypothetical protein NIES4075_70440 [Tolypothrix sp. NIES-4075]|uniref:hypothetical protein n=1 Tax=Tolypothrix sp. NIES-4075 TaxID=2005459 RepID=UPI000B5C2216|nr:hypothetical protein [Tolypothrix sp. NIES-4075]GAX46023.1 hypothetical protein NIES4075_70440 [Tolypothrix sp. NIES-4075]
MPFDKDNPHRYERKLKRPLGKMIGFRGYENQNEQIKAVPDWQERLREYVEQLISENSPQDE